MITLTDSLRYRAFVVGAKGDDKPPADDGIVIEEIELHGVKMLCLSNYREAASDFYERFYKAFL